MLSLSLFVLWNVLHPDAGRKNLFYVCPPASTLFSVKIAVFALKGNKIRTCWKSSWTEAKTNFILCRKAPDSKPTTYVFCFDLVKQKSVFSSQNSEKQSPQCIYWFYSILLSLLHFIAERYRRRELLIFSFIIETRHTHTFLIVMALALSALFFQRFFFSSVLSLVHWRLITHRFQINFYTFALRSHFRYQPPSSS